VVVERLVAQRLAAQLKPLPIQEAAKLF
jgi:hypothetical protein